MSTHDVQIADRPLRECNQDIQAGIQRGLPVIVTDTRSRHNLGIGLPAGAQVHFEGSVGYYCGGLNNGANITVSRNAGWAAGEAMASGDITINGYAGVSLGASMLGGLIHVKGDAGHHCRRQDRLSVGFYGTRRPHHRPGRCR